MAGKLVPAETQRAAVIAAALPPLLVALQLIAALLYPLAWQNRAWSQNAVLVLGCEILAVHAGVLTSGFVGWRSALRLPILAALGAFYAMFLVMLAKLANSGWLTANIGLVLLVRLVAAVHDGGRGAGERIVRGFLILVLFLFLILPPVLAIRRFPAFGYSPEVYAQLKDGLAHFEGLIRNGGNLARTVVLAALFYLLSSLVELVRLRTITRETSAPGLAVAGGTLALHADGRQLTLAPLSDYAGGLLALMFGALLLVPLVAGLAFGDFAGFVIGVFLFWFALKVLRSGLATLFSRRLCIARKGEIELREEPLWGAPVVRVFRGDSARALLVNAGYVKTGRVRKRGVVGPNIFEVALKAGNKTVPVIPDLDTEADAEGLRKMLAAYVDGVEQAQVSKALHEDRDVRALLDAHAEAAAGSS